MIFTLSILINLCLIFAVYRLFLAQKKLHLDYWDCINRANKQLNENGEYWTKLINNYGKRTDREIYGKLSKVIIDSKVATKMADRAFNMASSATLGVVGLQKSLAVPRLLTKEQVTRNQLAKQEVDKLFTTPGSMEWLKPILSEQDLDILEKAEDSFLKNQNGKMT